MAISTAASTEPIGFVGLGAMGAPMARHLATLGHRVLVCDVNPRAVESVVNCGARACASPNAVATEARLVFTCLPSLEVLKEVALGENGLHAGGAIKTYVDLSTTGAEFARELAAALQRCGIMMLDSPITGSVATAGNGKLGIMCSGPQPAFRHAEPIMRDLASAAVLYLGEQNGKAQTLKLLNNLLSATGMAASCEAFILGVKGGLDAKTMLDVFNFGEASCNATRNKFPRSILTRQFDYGARMAITAKDISLSVKEAEELGVPMWIGQAVRQIWKYAISQGAYEKDGTALITYLEPWAGVEVRGNIDFMPPETGDAIPLDRIDRHIVFCDAAVLPSLARRLRAKKLSVEIAGQDRGQQTICTLVGVAAEQKAEDILTYVPADSGRRSIINACLCSSTLAVEIANLFSERGDTYLDALFTGTNHDIENGGAALVVSGPGAAFAGAKSLLEAVCDRLFYISDKVGAAQLMQQINGSLIATLFAATCESYVAGAKAGLPPQTMTKILGIETGRTAASARIIPDQVATRKFNHGKSISAVYRELSLASDEARRLKVTPWILDKTRLLYGLASQLGSSGDDVTRLITHYEKWANVEVNSGMPGVLASENSTTQVA